MLVLDLDGTTLNERGQLEERDIAAAHALVEAGVHVTIATGRLFTGTQWVADALGVQGPIAVMNGSELIDAQSGTLVAGNYVGPEIRAHARRTWAEAGLSSAFLFGSRRIHIGRHDVHNRTYLETWTTDLTVHDDLFGTVEWVSSPDVVAIGTAGSERAIAHARQSLHRHLPDEIGSVTFQTHGGDTFLKVRHAEENKGTALRRIAEHHGFGAAQCVAVGDWMNDLSMLSVAGRSFAMNGAPDAVVDHAHGVLDAVRGEGGAVQEIARRVWGLQV